MKAKRAPSAASLDEWDGHLAAGHADHRGWCPSCVVGKGKSEAHRRMEAPRKKMRRERRQLLGKFSKDRWLIPHTVPCKATQHRWIVGKPVSDVIMSGVQTLVVKSDQEVSIVDVKNSLMRELRGVEGSTAMLEESPVGARAANVVIERSVWEMPSSTRAIVSYAEW